VQLLHVVSDPGYYAPGSAAPIILPETYLNDLRESGRQALERVKLPGTSDDVTVTRHLEIGGPVETILRHAHVNANDLICIGTHGRSGLSRLALGSVAERVVQRSKCPVLVAHAGAKSTRDVAIRRILVPVDFGDFTTPTLAAAGDLARKVAAPIDLVHVIADIVPARSEIPIAYREIEVSHREIRKWADQELARLDVAGVKVTRHVLCGNPFEQIVNYAGEHGVDLICLATHGRTGIVHWFLGSVAEMVVRKASCSVLVMPHPDRNEHLAEPA
jgi:nucleotide-binding universal stress UspA family protein